MAKMARKWAGDGLIECQNNATALGSKEAWLGERSHLARGATLSEASGRSARP
jgi:hypothetical protein